MSELYVARTSGTVMFEGRRHAIRSGQTIARAGHPILAQHPRLFKPLQVHFNTSGGSGLVEQATARPGELRELPPPAGEVAQTPDAAEGIPCDEPECEVAAKSPSGLAAHKRAKH